MAKSAALNRQTISTIARRGIRYAGVASVSLQGIGCGDELITIINDLRTKKPISTVYIAQFGAQLFFLAFSIKNFQLTEKLTEVSGTRNPKSIRKILKQHNSNGSFKYLFVGADFMEKNIQGVTTSMLRIIFENCLNVTDKVKNECERAFDMQIYSILDECDSNHVNTMKKKTLLKTLLQNINFKSLKKLLNFTKKFITKSSQAYREKKMENLPFEHYLKTVYMAIYNRTDVNENINASILSLTENDFDDLASEIISMFVSNGDDLSKEFDSKFEVSTDVKLGRKIYLMITLRCEKFVNDLQRFSISESREQLYEVIENILKRLTFETATLFFGLVKSILNEYILQLPMPEAIQTIFQKLVKEFNGDLIEMEVKLKTYLLNKNKDNGDKSEKDFIDKFFSKKALELRDCSVCGGQKFV